MKQLTPFLLLFALLIGISMVMRSQDPITEAVVEARSQTSTGVIKMDVIDNAFALLFHITTGGIIATALGWAVMNLDKLGKIYRHWWSGKLKRRWEPGPNANYQQREPRAQKLTDKELLMLMVANNGRLPNARNLRVPRRAEQEADDTLDLNL